MKRKLVLSLLITMVFASMVIPAALAWRTPGYWKNRGARVYDWVDAPPNDWHGMYWYLGGPIDDADAFEILWMDKSIGDATVILAFQMIAYRLNVDVLGAYEYPCMAAIFADALDALDAAGGIGADPAPHTAIRAECISLAYQLDLINNDLFL